MDNTEDVFASRVGQKTRRSIALSFRGSSGQFVTTASNFILNFYENAFVDPDTASRLSLAAHELLENSVKYSSDGMSNIEIHVLSTPEGREQARITLRNRATRDRIEELRGLLEEICSSSDPLSLYYDFIARTAVRDDGSGLGLVRIRAEAEMDIRYTIDDDQVTLVAETEVTTAEGA